MVEHEDVGDEDLYLTDGDYIVVDGAIYPMLKEWEWTKDPISGLIVRTTDRKPLFDTILYWHIRKYPEITARPLPEKAASRHIFAGHPSYHPFLLLAAKQREFLLWEEEYHTPVATEYLREALTYVLSECLTWEMRGQRWVFTPDPDGITPGTLELAPIGVSHLTLGAWMEELTGGYVRDKDTATGLRPETFGDTMIPKLRAIWRDIAHDENCDDLTPKQAERALREADRPVAVLAGFLKEMLASYRLRA